MDFANFSNNALLFTDLQEGLESGAKLLGVTLHNYDNNADSVQTLANARTMAQDKPDVILEYNPVANIGPRLAQTFQSAKIPCVAINIPFDGCPYFNHDEVTLSTDLATQMAAIMKTKGWTGKNTTAVIMDHPQDGEAVNIFVWQAYVTLASLVPDMSQVPLNSLSGSTTTIGATGLQVDGGDTQDSAYAAFQAGLNSIPKDRNIVLFTIDDTYTVPALRALKQAGRASNALVSGFGSSEQAITALSSEPAWVLEATSFFKQWGEFLLAMSQALVNGVTPPKQTYPPAMVLTKENVASVFPPGSNGVAKQLPELPEADKYLIATGVLQKFGNVQGIS